MYGSENGTYRVLDNALYEDVLAFGMRVLHVVVYKGVPRVEIVVNG